MFSNKAKKIDEEALNAVKFFGWLKKFRPAQKILGPVKGQGMSNIKFKWKTFSNFVRFSECPNFTR